MKNLEKRIESIEQELNGYLLNIAISELLGENPNNKSSLLTTRVTEECFEGLYFQYNISIMDENIRVCKYNVSCNNYLICDLVINESMNKSGKCIRNIIEDAFVNFIDSL